MISKNSIFVVTNMLFFGFKMILSNVLALNFTFQELELHSQIDQSEFKIKKNNVSLKFFLSI